MNAGESAPTTKGKHTNRCRCICVYILSLGSFAPGQAGGLLEPSGESPGTCNDRLNGRRNARQRVGNYSENTDTDPPVHLASAGPRPTSAGSGALQRRPQARQRRPRARLFRPRAHRSSKAPDPPAQAQGPAAQAQGPPRAAYKLQGFLQTGVRTPEDLKKPFSRRRGTVLIFHYRGAVFRISYLVAFSYPDGGPVASHAISSRRQATRRTSRVLYLSR